MAKRAVRAWLVLASAALVAAAPTGLWADEAAGEEGSEEQHLELGFEVKTNLRHSDARAFPVKFPFAPSMLPVGQDVGFEKTVNPGTHLEVSVVSLFLEGSWGEAIDGRLKVDLIDLYDRNPTSGDRQIDIDEAWLRFGRETLPGEVAESSTAYAKVGKMPKFERQNDRHLESYGLASTAFNRFEDVGLEVGGDLGRHVFFRLAATQGNPVFIRDPNALAGDNGTDDLLQPNPDPELGTGIVILYDAEVEGLDVDGDLELGAGLGFRFGDDAGRHRVDLLFWGYQRDLAETVELEGTFYGGDLDLLRGPFNQFGLPITDDQKQEVGGNIWAYLGGFSFFGQVVDQEIAGMTRTSWEAEAAWRFDLPLRWSVGGRQLFPGITPVVRLSRLEPEFAGGAAEFPAPSVRWEWDKIDLGVRLEIVEGIDLTLEVNQNTFVRAGRDETNDEGLVTLRWKR